MRRYCMISVLIFVVGCSLSGRAVRVEREKTGKKELTEIVSRKQKAPKIKETTLKREEAKPGEEITGKQKDAKPQKPSPAEEKNKELTAKAEEEQKAARAEKELMEEITGLIIEQTMTKIGYSFYEYFFLLWKPPEVEIKRYNILISEKASPHWGSWIKVDVNGTSVWSRVLRPRSEEIEEAVKQAIEATKQYLYHYEQYQLQTEDMVGSGI